MTLGERCDEIVRLIDETLLDCESTSPPAHLSAERPGQDAFDLTEPLAKTA